MGASRDALLGRLLIGPLPQLRRAQAYSFVERALECMHREEPRCKMPLADCREDGRAGYGEQITAGAPGARLRMYRPYIASRRLPDPSCSHPWLSRRAEPADYSSRSREAHELSNGLGGGGRGHRAWPFPPIRRPLSLAWRRAHQTEVLISSTARACFRRPKISKIDAKNVPLGRRLRRKQVRATAMTL